MKTPQLKIQLILFFLFPFFAIAQKKEPIKILFVGNSFTYYWNMPELVGAMAESQGIAVEVYQSTVGGSNLEQHYTEKNNTVTQTMLANKKWNYVILQDYSSRTITDLEKFTEYTGKFISLIRDKKAKPILFMTWAYKSNPLMQESITNEYNKLGKSTQTNVVPIGEIFARTRKVRPDLNLFHDNKHPSPDASYLIALCFYKALFGGSLNKIPGQLKTIDKYGQSISLSFVTAETADFLKQIVNESNIVTLH